MLSIMDSSAKLNRAWENVGLKQAVLVLLAVRVRGNCNPLYTILVV